MIEVTPVTGTSMADPAVPAHAVLHAVGDSRVAVWSDTSTTPPHVRAMAETPSGGGTAQLDEEPSTLALQVRDIGADVGSSPLTLRRNGPKLRAADRCISISGPGRSWELRRTEDGAAIESTSGRRLWQRAGRVDRVDPSVSPDELAVLVLLQHVRLEHRLGPGWLAAL